MIFLHEYANSGKPCKRRSKGGLDDGSVGIVEGHASRMCISRSRTFRKRDLIPEGRPGKLAEVMERITEKDGGDGDGEYRV